MKLIPTFLSLLRLFASAIACSQFIVSGEITFPSYALLAGIVTDIMDGAVARRYNTATLSGHRLDILADGICFALMPCVCIAREGLSDFVIGFGLLFYAVTRVHKTGWECTGIPLPIVGTAVFVLSITHQQWRYFHAFEATALICAFTSTNSWLAGHFRRSVRLLIAPIALSKEMFVVLLIRCRRD
jgi:phosphatidylglycerophosphate synthase